uniref:Argininosuccinate lyase n=1 Tax=Candidatus Kentrum sp. TC TaxID=2126339 RepID=A0A450ZYA3_9GAMM|nr:MAG: argininosuccinate lyase [Candidatus Kentron sp. TC]VFK42690.1 MAG: argininosuccinate lyase [Candidatus Kentron sp. TC]VFK58755.1 MAG: argininosuccinate lyase [Candidatus Kentron sp. TC]
MFLQSPNKKPWSGRFTEAASTLVEEFTASVAFDQRLYPFDLLGSIAHATMLGSVGVLSADEQAAIIEGLEGIGADIEAGRFEWSEEWEDVHMNIEVDLVKRIGESGKKLHTGRSRNDQVATDLRLYLREETDLLVEELGELQSIILDIAEREAETPMPGFTHLQVAQPITFGHHMLAWFEMLARDRERLLDARGRINRMPLGAAALAGTDFPINRTMTAELLGFEKLCENSIDAVSDRDFAIEFTAAAALIMTHLSRMSEELILWSSTQFDFIELGDGFCTGSSIMPQKKNPDIPELVRGKTGRVNGHLLALLVLMKGQPLAYNRDNQEDKEAIFDTVDTTKACVRIYTQMLTSMTLKYDHMRIHAGKGFSTATDLADYLVRKGVPFRDAHEIVGRAVRYGIDAGTDLATMTLEELQEFASIITADVFSILSLEGSIASRNHIGGTAPEQVRKAIIRARRRS